MRKPKFKRRDRSPDVKYKEPLVTQFVNNLMLRGKKMQAFSCFYDALARVEEATKESGLEVWRRALDNVMPSVEVKSRRVGGATFQVPIEVRAARKITLGQKWLIRFARARKEHTMDERLAHEIIAAAKGEGAAVKKKDDTHRMAEANKAFSHFRF